MEDGLEGRDSIEEVDLAVNRVVEYEGDQEEENDTPSNSDDVDDDIGREVV